MKQLLLPLLIAPLLLAAPAAAQGFQDTAALDRAVAAFTDRAIGDVGGARSIVDTRLKLANCPTLALSWHGAAHDAVVVTCTGPEWRIYVPVRAGTTAFVAVGSQPPLPVKALPVIKRGDPVTIAAGSPGFSITREGIALGDAAPGGRFMVKVDDTRAPVQAVAIASGRATLPGWAD